MIKRNWGYILYILIIYELLVILTLMDLLPQGLQGIISLSIGLIMYPFGLISV